MVGVILGTNIEIDDVSIDFNQNCFFKKNKKYTVLGRSQGPISSVLSIYKKWRKGGKEERKLVEFFFIFLLLRFFIYFFLFKSYEGPDELTSYLIFFFLFSFFLSFVSFFFFFVSFLIVIFHSAKNRFSRI